MGHENTSHKTIRGTHQQRWAALKWYSGLHIRKCCQCRRVVFRWNVTGNQPKQVIIKSVNKQFEHLPNLKQVLRVILYFAKPTSKIILALHKPVVYQQWELFAFRILHDINCSHSALLLIAQDLTEPIFASCCWISSSISGCPAAYF